MSQRLALDSVAIRDERLFGWGWFLDDVAAAERVSLRIHGMVDRETTLSFDDLRDLDLVHRRSRRTGLIVGAGATARSAMIALAELGCVRVTAAAPRSAS